MAVLWLPLPGMAGCEADRPRPAGGVEPAAGALSAGGATSEPRSGVIPLKTG